MNLDWDDILINNVGVIERVLLEFNIDDYDFANVINEYIYDILKYIQLSNREIFYNMDHIEFLWIFIRDYVIGLELLLEDYPLILEFVFGNIIIIIEELIKIYLIDERYELCHNLNLHINYIKIAANLDDETTDNK